MTTRANALAVMAKAPVAGQVKTRLQPPLSAEEAAKLARALLVDQLHHLSRLTVADLYLAFTPVHAGKQMKGLAPRVFQLFAQQGGDLGARMSAIFDRLFGSGYKNVIIIGGDLAPLPPQWIEHACAFLESNSKRVVLGPAHDGGYYLVGSNQLVPQIFEGMSWSHKRVLADTRAKLARLGIDYELLPLWFDIDTADDLRYLKIIFASELQQSAPNTHKLLRRLRDPLQ